MEKTKREEGQKTGRWARWISRAYLSLALAAVVLTVRTCCPGAVETVRDVLGLGEGGRTRAGFAGTARRSAGNRAGHGRDAAMSMSAIAARAAALLLTSEKGRKGVGFLLVAIFAPLLGNRLRRTQQLRPDSRMLQNASPVLRGSQRAKRKIIPKPNALPPQPIVCEDAAF